MSSFDYIIMWNII